MQWSRQSSLTSCWKEIDLIKPLETGSALEALSQPKLLLQPVMLLTLGRAMQLLNPTRSYHGSVDHKMNWNAFRYSRQSQLKPGKPGKLVHTSQARTANNSSHEVERKIRKRSTFYLFWGSIIFDETAQLKISYTLDSSTMSLEIRFKKFQMVDADVGNQMLIGEHSLRSRRYDQLCWRISQNSRFQKKTFKHLLHDSKLCTSFQKHRLPWTKFQRFLYENNVFWRNRLPLATKCSRHVECPQQKVAYANKGLQKFRKK